MEQEKLIIDYIIEQAERFDIKNLQFEEDIKFNLRGNNKILFIIKFKLYLTLFSSLIS